MRAMETAMENIPTKKGNFSMLVKNARPGAAGAAQRRAAPPQAAEQGRGCKSRIQECPFAPYFEIDSGVGRFRGPGDWR